QVDRFLSPSPTLALLCILLRAPLLLSPAGRRCQLNYKCCISGPLLPVPMSRPTTRNKNKRHRPEDEIDVRSEVYRRIHAQGNVTKDDVDQLYNVRKTVCQGCRVNTKDNPNCFCGLIPPPNGSRKTGLWQKISEIVSSLGPDPSDDLRESVASPAGLTNLGATCYANSILQFLFMNRAFRGGLYSVEPVVLKEQPVLDQLARLFAQLQSSKLSVTDSAPFIKTLELDNGVQQDSNEFLTLLLSLLERCLSHSKVPKARTVVQDLFRGCMSHVTRCSKCGRDSEASQNLEDFYELELNIKGLKNLDGSLDDYLNVEALEGDNQYYCELCGTHADATRCIKLRTLPPILNFQLKRCIFHQKTTTKKKITSSFTFPRELDMSKRLSDPSQSSLIYELSAVLVHKGTAVNSGHYVAHIKDATSGQWWEFDDEHVSNLGLHPFGEGSSRSVSKPVEESGQITDSSELTNASSNEDHNIHLLQTHIMNGHTETYTSTDAYMLMYTIIRDEKEDAVILSNGNISLPSHLSEEIDQLNASCHDACQKYKLRKEDEVNKITERRQEVRSVLSDAPVLSIEEPHFWMATDWLRQWADNVSVSIIDNSSLICLHGKVPASKISSMKRLSANAWTLLHSKYCGGPCLGDHDYCPDCLLDDAKAIVNADNYRDRRLSMKEIAEAALAGKLQQWLRRKNNDFPCEADTGPTAAIRCPHGELLPEQVTSAKRVLVPENFWLFLYENSNLIKPEDEFGCSTFPSDSNLCSQCCMELTEVACFEDSLREVKLKQRQNHEKLALGKSITLSSNCRYYLLPSSWISKWRNYVNTSGKNISASTEPEPLAGIISSLKCDKHLMLLERPPSLMCKRGMTVQKLSATDGMTIVTENDWKIFCEEWGGMFEQGIVAEIEYNNMMDIDQAGSCQEVPVNVDQTNDEATDEVESREPIIRTSPKVCEECIGERESCELMQKLNYSNEEICVCLVRGKDVPKSLLEASKNMFEPDRRTSKRSRKTSFGNSINLKVSGSTSVYQLKMMIWESLGVVKENQLLHKGTKVLEDESLNLADFNIFPGDVLWVMDSKVHENRDIADELSDPKTEVQQSEEGFRGTLLTSSTQSQRTMYNMRPIRPKLDDGIGNMEGPLGMSSYRFLFFDTKYPP
ncbi:hypothetical protein V2J09_000366, partial [Rumex salicifolius]